MRKHLFTAVLLLLSLLLTSCRQPESTVEIDSDIPEEIIAQDESLTMAMPNRWWQSFGDDELNSLIDLSLEENLSLKQMSRRVEQARLEAKIAGADLYPSADISGDAERSRRYLDQSGEEHYSSLYSTGFVVNYELDLWGRARAAAAAGVYQLDSVKQDYQAARISIAAQIANVWFGLIESKRRLELVNKQIKLNSDTLETVTMQFRRGRAAASDVFQQRQLLESKQGSRSQIKSRIEVYKTLLAVLSGSSPNSRVVEPSSALPEIEKSPSSVSVTQLVRRRPDIQAAYYTVKAYDRTAAQAMANKMPKISLSAAVSSGSDRIKGLFDRWQSSIAADLAMPLFDAGVRDAEADRQQSLKEEAALKYTETVYNAVKEVRDAYVREVNQKDFVRSLREQLILSKQSVERIRDGYIKGQEDFIRLLSAQQSAQGLELELVSAEKELVSYRIDLFKALAGRIEDN